MNNSDLKLEEIITNYDFKNSSADLSLIYFLLKTYKNNLIGAMVDIWKGEELVKLLDNCDNITKIYAIDDHKPYVQKIFNPRELIDIKIAETCKFFADHYIKYSNNKRKIVRLNTDALNALNKIKDNSLDFVIITRPSNQEEIEQLYIEYYKKLKSGGYIIGVNYDIPEIKSILDKLVENKYFNGYIHNYGFMWTMRKE